MASGDAVSDPLAAIELVVMARVPLIGAVKTRLAARIGAERAYQVYAAMLADLADRLRLLPSQVTWMWTPAGLPRPSFGERARHADQCAGDLGARMAQAIAARHGATGRPVLVLGVDAPHIQLAWLREAATALQRGTDVVLGPALDGGYWTIGVRQPMAELFRNVPWGTNAVLATTKMHARAAGRTVFELPPTFDIDTWEDLLRLRAVVTADPAVLPRTAALLVAVQNG